MNVGNHGVAAMAYEYFGKSSKCRISSLVCAAFCLK